MPNLKQYRLNLVKAMVAKQSSDIDVITGATQRSNRCKAAVSDLIHNYRRELPKNNAFAPLGVEYSTNRYAILSV